MSSSGSSPSAAPSAPPPPMWTPEQLATMPHNDLGRTVIAVMWPLVTVSGLFLGLRLFCKRLTNRSLWWDDYVLTVAWICLAVDASIRTLAVSYGYGKHTWDFPMQNLEHTILLMYVAGTFSIVGIIWSKTSVAITLIRLTEERMRVFVWFLLVTTNIFLGLSAVFNWAQCKPIEKVWRFSVPGTCWPISTLVNYHIFSGVYSALMDFSLALLPWKLIWTLQMGKLEKFGIGLAMSMGVFAGVAAIVKTSFLPSMKSSDLQDTVVLIYWIYSEMAVTIVAASIPVLRVLIRDVRRSTTGYHDAEESNYAPGRSHGSGIGTTVTTRGSKTRRGSSSGNQSDDSILGGEPGRNIVLVERRVEVKYSQGDVSDFNEPPDSTCTPSYWPTTPRFR